MPPSRHRVRQARPRRVRGVTEPRDPGRAHGLQPHAAAAARRQHGVPARRVAAVGDPRTSCSCCSWPGFLALALNPAVTWLELHGWRRGRAVAVVFVVDPDRGRRDPRRSCSRRSTRRCGSSPTTCPATSTTCAGRGCCASSTRATTSSRSSRTRRRRCRRGCPARRARSSASRAPSSTPSFKAFTVIFLTMFLLLELPAIGRSILSLLAPASAERTRVADGRHQRHRRPLRGG